MKQDYYLSSSLIVQSDTVDENLLDNFYKLIHSVWFDSFNQFDQRNPLYHFKELDHIV